MEILKLKSIRMPVLFIGHGSPENALADNEFTMNWRKIAGLIPTPKAILSISAHWITEKTEITGMEKPKTIHDFYGFQEELYKIEYGAKGSPGHAERIKKMIKTVKIRLDNSWGLDHGTWSVLLNMYPKAEIPVLQLSLDYEFPFEKHVQIGRELKTLRDEGVLIIGSGNLVHNLSQMSMTDKPYPWAVEFDGFVKESLIAKDYGALVNFQEHKSGNISHPTYDHYLPLLHVIGAAEGMAPVFFNEKIVYGSVGMRSILFSEEKIKI